MADEAWASGERHNVNPNECAMHSGMVARVNSLEDARNLNMAEHTKLRDAIDGVRNRLPVWAVFAISVLSALTGAVVGAAVKAALS